MRTDQIDDNGIFSENNLRAFLEEQLQIFKTEKTKKMLLSGKKFSKEDTIIWLSCGFVMRAALEIDPNIFVCALERNFKTVWTLDCLEDDGVLIGAYAFRLADYLWWKMSENDVESTGEYYCGYDANRNHIDVDPSTMTPKSCFEEYFVQDTQCVLEHSNDMIQELKAYYTEVSDDGHMSFLSFLSDMISAYPQEALVIYSTIHCLLEDLSIQQAMTEYIEDCEAGINTQTKQDSDFDTQIRMLVADLVMKKAEDLDIVKA